MTRKIVSYSYFRSPTSQYEKLKGDAAIQFQQFLKMLVRAHHCIWRGYEMRIHYDSHVPQLPYWPTMRKLHDEKLLRLVYCGDADPLCKSMLWRMIPVFVEQNPVVVCRDIDSVPMLRDRLAVEEWLGSGLAVHCIHDNAAHSGVMGGTTSVHAERFRQLIGVQTMKEFLALGADLDWDKQGADQHLLNRLLPRYAHQTLVHELHHRVNDMGPVEVRDHVTPFFPDPAWTPEIVASDKLCPSVGGCTDPQAAFEFYDAINFPERDLIRSCER